MMMTPRLPKLSLGAALAAGLLSVAGAGAGLAQDADKPLPGYWQYSYRTPISNSDEMRCLSKADVARFFDGLCNKGSTCTYSTNEAHNGKVKLVGVWVDHKGRNTKVNADGTYDPKAFHLNAQVAVGALAGLTVPGTIDGKWTDAACPAGSENAGKKP
jgi:hypothetical protein